MRFKISMLCLVLSISSVTHAERFTLNELYELAIEKANSKAVETAKKDYEIAHYNKLSSLSNMGPKFSTSAQYMHWNEPVDVSFGFQLPPQFASMGINIPDKMHVMDQDTKSLSFTIAQPITPLYTLYHVYKINSLNEEASIIDLERQKRDIRYKVAETFFNILKLEKTRENLLASIKLVQSYKDLTVNLFKNGMIQKDDVMKVDVKLASIKDALLEVESGISVMKSLLNTMIGRNPSDEMELAADLSDAPQPLDISLDESIQKALENRSEIRSLTLRTDMLYAKKQTTIGGLIPSVVGLFTYSKQWGNLFQPDESWFIGGQLSWTFWEWGSTYFQLKANNREIEKAKLGLTSLKDGVIIDVKNAFFKTKNSYSSLLSNKKSIELAEEVYRIAVKKYENAQITATEVLDAETMLTNARINYANALYSYYLSLEDLKRAIDSK